MSCELRIFSKDPESNKALCAELAKKVSYIGKILQEALSVCVIDVTHCTPREVATIAQAIRNDSRVVKIAFFLTEYEGWEIPGEEILDDLLRGVEAEDHVICFCARPWAIFGRVPDSDLDSPYDWTYFVMALGMMKWVILRRKLEFKGEQLQVTQK